MIIFECPVPVMTELGVIRESEFHEDDGWIINLLPYDTGVHRFVMLSRKADIARGLCAVPENWLSGYKFTFTRPHAAEAGKEEHRSEHSDRNSGRKTEGSGDRHRGKRGAKGQKEEAKVESDRPVAIQDLSSGKDRALGRLLG